MRRQSHAPREVWEDVATVQEGAHIVRSDRTPAALVAQALLIADAGGANAGRLGGLRLVLKECDGSVGVRHEQINPPGNINALESAVDALLQILRAAEEVVDLAYPNPLVVDKGCCAGDTGTPGEHLGAPEYGGQECAAARREKAALPPPVLVALT
jgi:hypothetical protein